MHIISGTRAAFSTDSRGYHHQSYLRVVKTQKQKTRSIVLHIGGEHVSPLSGGSEAAHVFRWRSLKRNSRRPSLHHVWIGGVRGIKPCVSASNKAEYTGKKTVFKINFGKVSNTDQQFYCHNICLTMRKQVGARLSFKMRKLQPIGGSISDVLFISDTCWF